MDEITRENLNKLVEEAEKQAKTGNVYTSKWAYLYAAHVPILQREIERLENKKFLETNEPGRG